MREAVRRTRWEYQNENGVRTVTGYDISNGKQTLKGVSNETYPAAILQAAYNRATQKYEGTNNTTVKPYDLSFKHRAAWPDWRDESVPPKNVTLEEVANSVYTDDQKNYVKLWGWSNETTNVGGARELLKQGPDVPPFLLTEEDDLEMLPETDEPVNDEEWDTFFDRDDVVFAQGMLASHMKNLIDDDCQVKLFEVPKTVSDPAFLTQLAYVDPPDGKTHDLSMNPEYGSNKSSDRKLNSRTTADFLVRKCKSFQRHFERYERKGQLLTMERTCEIIEEAMKDPQDSSAIFTTFKGFKKMEEMTAEKIRAGAAQRTIWAPGQVEAILGKLLMKNVTLASFQRYERGNAHGTQFAHGGVTELFKAMMSNVRDRATLEAFLNENNLPGTDVPLIDEWNFKQMLAEFGWRDDDLKKWDLMQFQVYMLLNLQFFMFSYDWPDVLTVDHAVWLYLFVVLATIDTTVVSDLGYGPELYVRILASGLFLTASGGSKTHDMLSHAYSFRQTNIARRMWRLAKSMPDVVDTSCGSLLRGSYQAFKLGTSFAHFSDDFLQCALRRGLPFGQLVSRTKFFADMFGLEFKVQVRNWHSEIGKNELFLLNKVLTLSDRSLFFDAFMPEDKAASMNGISKIYHYLSYEQRVKQWYPLTSELFAAGEMKDGKEQIGIKRHGVNFLKFHFCEAVDHRGVITIIPIRDHFEMYHKLFFSKVKYRTPAQIMVKLRMYAYYCFKYPSVLDTFRRIHDIFKSRFAPDLVTIKNDPLLAKELPRKLNLSLEELVADFPDETTVSLFYLPAEQQPYASITDLRQRIMRSKYRACKHNIWELIRQKDVQVDIGGVYPYVVEKKKTLQYYERRERIGLVKEMGERKKPPSRHLRPYK